MLCPKFNSLMQKQIRTEETFVAKLGSRAKFLTELLKIFLTAWSDFLSELKQQEATI